MENFEDLLVLIVNFSGWGVVLYLAKIYFAEIKTIKVEQDLIKKQHASLMTEQKLQEQRMLFLERVIKDVDKSLEEIKETLKINNVELIRELKEQLRNK